MIVIMLFASTAANINTVYLGSTFNISIWELGSVTHINLETASIGLIYCTVRYASTNLNGS